MAKHDQAPQPGNNKMSTTNDEVIVKIQDRLKPNSIIKNHYGGYQRYKPRFIVGYWSIRGLGAPIRMLLSAAQIDHWVVLYDVVEKENDEKNGVSGGGGGGWDKSTWLQDKEWLQKEISPLINLPFLVDCRDERVMSQTNAILSYLGRELKMLGDTPQEVCYCEELLCEIMDLRNLMVRFAYHNDDGNDESSTTKKDAEQLIIRARVHFNKLEVCLQRAYPGAHNRWISDDEVSTIGFYMNSVCHLIPHTFTAPDFHLWEMLDQFDGLSKHFELDCLGTATTYSEVVDQIQHWLKPKEARKNIFPYLKEFHECFIHLKANEVYCTQYPTEFRRHRANDDAIILPYNNPYARFGSDPKTLGKYTTRNSSGQQEQQQEEAGGCGGAPWRNLGIRSKRYTRINSDIEYWDDEAMKEAQAKLPRRVY